MRVNLSVAIVSMVNQTAIPHMEDNDTSDVCNKTKPINGTFVPVTHYFLSSSSYLNVNIILLFNYHITVLITSFRYQLSRDVGHSNLSCFTLEYIYVKHTLYCYSEVFVLMYDMSLSH